MPLNLGHDDLHNSALEEALRYMRRGWSVIPLRPGSKKPVGPWLKNQTERADEAQIRAWFTQHPEWNIGIVTGDVSGRLVVIDVDKKPELDGNATLAALCMEHCDSLPSTVEAETGGGGRHLLFHYPEGVCISNSKGTDNKLGPGIDVRANGGYIVAPPSVHENGNAYGWKQHHAPLEDVRANDLPNWFLDLIKDAPAASNENVVRNDTDNTAKYNADGLLIDGREDLMRKIVAKGYSDLSVMRLGQQLTEQQLFDNCWPLYRCQVAGTDEQLEAADRGFSEMIKKVRYILTDQRQEYLRSSSTGAAGSEAVGSTADDDTAPLDIFGDPTFVGEPDLPHDCLPAVIDNFARDNAERLGVAPAMVALPAVAVAAAAIDDRFVLQPRKYDTEWTESARLWIAIVEEPGGKKTPAIKAAIAPLSKIELGWTKEDAVKQEEYALKDRIFEEQMKTWVKKRAKGEDVERPTRPERPSIRRRIVNDTTIEALSDVLIDNPSGILVLHDELTGWFGSFDAYRSAQGKDRASWLELYEGGGKRIDRVKRGNVFVENWSASLVGGIRPGPMKKVIGKISDDGLLQRFMVVYGKQPGAGFDRPPDEQAMQAYQNCIKRLVTLEPGERMAVRLSEGARKALDLVLRTAAEVKRLPDTSSAFRAHLGKWPGLFARLTLTFHAIESVSADRPITEEVAASTAKRVGELMLDYLLPNAALFYWEIASKDDRGRHARWIAGHILAHSLEKISPNVIGRSFHELRGDKDAIYRAMAVLETAGWVSPLGLERGSPKRWTVVPEVHKRFALQAQAERVRREQEIKKARDAMVSLGPARKKEPAA